jgi:ABC-type transport system involved in cytochrome bd biosynthesis fused ATPase/permease subunit
MIREISQRQRGATVATLRITFLSALVLELVATLSVAVVAVATGTKPYECLHVGAAYRAAPLFPS